jgi:MFS superfamily sulfate permease-like transporter
VEATDKLDPEKRVTPTNRELIAQGIGNLTSGLIGGLPVTQVIVRSSANIQSGGKSKASALFHGILILLSAMLIPNILNMIPLASLAGILFVVGYKLAKPALFKQMYKEGWNQFIPFVVTVVAIYFTDLLVGIGIGLSVGIFIILLRNYLSPYIVETKEDDNNHYRIKLAQNVTFLNKASILKTLNEIPEGSSVLIDASNSNYIEHDVLEIIQDFKQAAKYKDIKLSMCCTKHLNLKGFKDSLNELMVKPDTDQ